ncbi:hypothetical protein CBS101457_000672 [Exobasidium rhododendri]|nr:hypothetical protein CBS101457_000672 [Exobasidium rhododendri]
MAAAGSSSKFQAFMNHPAGPKTVFFWAPMMKWCLVAAGVKDLGRPAENLSVGQNTALAATGLIWVRYSLVITPVNYSLAAVNFFVGLTGVAQLYRIYAYKQEQGKSPILSAVKDAENSASRTASNIKSEAKSLGSDIKSEAKAFEHDVKKRVG